MIEILKEAGKLGMVVNFHGGTRETVEPVLKNCPGLKVILAHPGEPWGPTGAKVRFDFIAEYENLYMDTSGTGLFRWNMLRYALDVCGAEKLLFGSDMPTCSAGMFVFGILSENLTEEEFREQELIPAAQTNLNQEMILGAIAEKAGITMTDEELEELLQGYADEYGITVEELTKGTDMETIRSSELQQKVMEWLFENVTVEEVEETESAGLFGNETEAETEVFAASGNETEAETEAFAASGKETEAETAAETEETASEKETAKESVKETKKESGKEAKKASETEAGKASGKADGTKEKETKK
jgi:hypothetical protein